MTKYREPGDESSCRRVGDHIICEMHESWDGHVFPGIKQNFRPGRSDDWWYIYHPYQPDYDDSQTVYDRLSTTPIPDEFLTPTQPSTKVTP